MLTICWVSVVGETVITSWQNPCNSTTGPGPVSLHLNSGKKYLPGKNKCALVERYIKTSLIYEIHLKCHTNS